MIFGMPTLIEQDNLEDALELCTKLGLDFVELNMNLPQYQIHQLEHTQYFKDLKDKYHVFYTIHLDENLNISDFNPLVANAYMETVERTIGVARELEAPVINMHMNHGIYITLPDRKVRMYARYKEVYMESMMRFRTMCEEAIGDANIRICIENTDGFMDYEKEAIALLLQSPVFSLTWDIGHSYAVGETDEPFLTEKEDRLDHFHIHDSYNKENHKTLGTGEIDLKKRLQLAEKNNCRCVVETKPVDALIQSVTWLEDQNWKRKK